MVMVSVTRQRARERWRGVLLLDCWSLQLVAGLLVFAAQEGAHGVLESCGPKCVMITTDGTDATAPAHFLNSVLNESVSEIVLTAPRYQLNPLAWAPYGKDNPYPLQRNLTVRSSVQPYGLMDFQLLESKVLLASGVFVIFKSIVLQNIRKLGGFAVDFFQGDLSSVMIMDDVIRVKLACQLPQDVLRSAKSFQRVNPDFPPNSVSLIPRYCASAAIHGSLPSEYCFENVLHFANFSLVAGSNDPDVGNQYPGYILYQQNTTRVCEHIISQQCLDTHGGDEELCMAMLVTEATGMGDSGFVWTTGAFVGIAAAAAVMLVVLAVCCYYRNHILLWCVRMGGKSLQDLESGSSQQRDEDGFDGHGQQRYNVQSGYMGSHRAISQQVTLGVLLGAGSFGRVYKGRWHSSDVAIKIMSCSRDELSKVLREAEVMMQLNHPNIVRAFHASVWNPAEQARALQAREARSATRSDKKPQAKRSSSNLGPPSNQQSSQQRASISTSAPTNALFPSSSSVGLAAAAAAAPPMRCTHSEDNIVINILPQVVDRPLPAEVVDAAPAGEAADDAVRCGDDTAHQWTPGAAAAPQLEVSAAGSAARSSQEVSGPRTGSANKEAALQAASTATASTSSTGDVGWSASNIAAADGSNHAAGLPARLGSAEPAIGPNGVSVQLLGGGPHLGSSIAASGSLIGSSNGAAGSGSLTRGSQAACSTGGSGPSAVAEARERFSSSSNASDGKDGGSGAAAPAGGSFKHHLLGRVKRSSSSNNSSPRPQPAEAADAAAAAGGRGSSSDDAGSGGAAAAGLGPGMALMHRPVQHDAGEQRHSGSGKSGRQQQGGEQRQDAQGNAADNNEENGIQQAEVQVWIVLELCSGGTLKDAVTTGKLRMDNKIDTAKVLARLLETANGMAYLHSKGVMHGDLKAGNVLLQNLHGGCDQVAKISDFGLAAVLLEGATHRSTASMGTITHMAPEVLRSGHMSPAADTYSFGIMMWEVFANRQAYQGLHYGAVVERVVIQKERPPIPQDMPEEFALLMCACWDAEPNNRPSFQQIVTCLELMLDNLSGNADSVSDDEEEMATMSSSLSAVNISGGAAVGTGTPGVPGQLQQQQGQHTPQRQQQRLEQQQQQQQQVVQGQHTPQRQQVVVPVQVVPAMMTGSRLSVSSGQQPGTPAGSGQQRLLMAALRSLDGSSSRPLEGSSSRPFECSVPHSARSHSFNSQSCVSGTNATSTLDANQFLQDL